MVCPRPSCGGQQLLLHCLWRVRTRRGYAALADASDCFDPVEAGEELLAHLLWVRCNGQAQAMKAVDLLLRDENFSLILLDLRDCAERELRRIPAMHWYRLQRLVARQSRFFITFTPCPLIPCAQSRYRLEGSRRLREWELGRPAAWQGLRLEPLRRRREVNTALSAALAG